MAVDLQGNIIDEKGTKTGGQVDVISGKMLQAGASVPFVQPDPPVGTDISGIDTDLPDPVVDTPATDTADDFATRFGDISSILSDPVSGVSATTSAAQEQAGVSALRTTQEDLVSQIKGFQLQSKDLENQFGLAGERVQQESRGRLRTTADISPLTADAQRRIALRQADIASQSLTASALLQATQGKLVTANRLVEEAVEKKFGPLIAEKEAIIENLKVLSLSGTLDREQQKIADAATAKAEAEKAEAEEAKEQADAINKIAVGVASKTDAQGNKPDALLLDKISKAGSELEAQFLATEAGFGEVAERDDFTLSTGQVRFDSDGNIIATGPAKAEGTGKALTGTQRVAAGFANRVEQAMTVIDELETDFTGRFARSAFVPESFKSEDRKKMEQAQRNFVNAVLRKESGAVIGKDEFESAEIQYFPQRGDSEAVLQQKKSNRQIAFQSLKLEAGEAFAELKGALPPVLEMVDVGGQSHAVGTILINSSGQRGRVEADGKITIL